MIHATHGRDQGRDAVVLDVRERPMRTVRSIFAAVCSLVLAFAMCLMGLTPAPAFADDASAIAAENGSITVNYVDGDMPIVGAKVSLYHVADWAPNSDRNTFTPVSPFSDSSNYKLDWSLLNSGGSGDYQQFATTLVGLIEKNKPTATETATTDANGAAQFTDLTKGLYLVLIDAYDDGTISCGPSYVLVALPSKSADAADAMTMDVTLEPKNDCETTPPTPPTETVKKKVVKVWKGDSAANRPGKIVVQLLQDGTVIDEVELNASNNWTHEWTDLPAGHDYQVVEKTVPDGYTVLMDRENDVITITNTYTPPVTPPTTPPDDHTPPSTPPTTPPNNNVPPIGETGSNVAVAAIGAGVLGGLGLILLMHRRRKAR
ncbi:hypothetical protein BG22_09845 [Bifidobacterium sp. UTBIF-78]|nr:hypothetical protein BG22_09845 [Bifidobacterium sp. UTBIF-78]